MYEKKKFDVMKKIMAVILSLAMVLGMGNISFAAESTSAEASGTEADSFYSCEDGIHDYNESAICNLCGVKLDSSHYISGSSYHKWIIKKQGAQQITLKFSSGGYHGDILYVMDKNNKEIDSFWIDELSSRTISINSDTVILKIYHQSSSSFSIDSIQYVYGDCADGHDYNEQGVCSCGDKLKSEFTPGKPYYEYKTMYKPGAVRLEFDLSYRTEAGAYDTFYLYDANGNQIYLNYMYHTPYYSGYYTDRVVVDCDKVSLKFDAGGEKNRDDWYSFSNIKAYYDDCDGNHTFGDDAICTVCGMKLESAHPLSQSKYTNWEIHRDGASKTAVTFSSKTELGLSEAIYIYDADDREIGRYLGSELAGKKIIVKGDTIKIKTETLAAYYNSEYGFSVTNIEAFYDDCLHDYDCSGVCSLCGEMLESEHTYSSSADNIWFVNKEGASSIALSFASGTKLASGDYLYVYGVDNRKVGKYSGSELASKTVIVHGDTAILQLKSNNSSTEYGFKVSSLTPQYGGCAKHDYNENGVCTVCGAKLESKHPVDKNTDETWVVNKPGATSIELTFSSSTRVATLYIYDADNWLVGKYTSYDLTSRKVIIEGDTAKIRMVSNSSSYYGFSVSSIKYSYDDCRHDYDEDAVCILCGAKLESSHPFKSKTDQIWTVEKPGAEAIALTFSENTNMGNYYHSSLIIYDADGNELIKTNNISEIAVDEHGYPIYGVYGEITHIIKNPLAGKTIYVKGDTIRIKINPEVYDYEKGYGFLVDSIKTYYSSCSGLEGEEHDYGVDGICSVCGIPLESMHPYPANCREEWNVNKPGATSIDLTFSETSKEDYCGSISVFDADGDNIGSFTCSELAGKTISIKGESAKIRLTVTHGTNILCSPTHYGFKVENVTAHYDSCSHSNIYAGGWYGATCEEGEYTEYICEDCGYSYKIYTSGALGHDYSMEGYNEYPTCTRDGFSMRQCSRCESQTFGEVYPRTEHQYMEVYRQEPTCMTEGYTEYECMMCLERMQSDYMPMTGHQYMNVERVEPTCMSDGYTIFECMYCMDRYEDYYYEYMPSDSSMHDYEEYERVDATCYSDGYITYRCKYCNDSYDEVLQGGHMLVTENKIPVSCTEDGYTGDIRCTRCGEVTEGRVIPALGHTLVEETDSEGNTVLKCERADGIEVVLDSAGYPESEHNYKDGINKTYSYSCDEAQSLNITFTSNTKVESKYDYIYIYDGNEKQIGKYTGTELASKTITVSGDHFSIKLTSDGSVNYYGFKIASITAVMPGCGYYEVHEHSFEAVDTKEAACTEDGYTTYKCSGCEETYQDDYVYAYGHNFAEYDRMDADCTENGYVIDRCTRCGTEGETHVLPALEHDYAVSEDKMPTCTEEGYRVYECTRCHDIYEGDRMPATEHNYEIIDIKEATCTEDGYTTYKCTNCEETYQADYVYAYGHDFVVYEDREATCTEDGYHEDRCTKCGEQGEAYSIPALGHDYIISETVAPTCTEGGYTVYECTRCHDTYEADYTEATGHGHDVYETEAPSCKTEGYTTYWCEKCGQMLETVYEDAVGHNYVEKETVEPGCANEGYTLYECEGCGDTYKENYRPAYGHNYILSGWKAATCAGEGYTGDVICTKCGDVKSQGSVTQALAHKLTETTSSDGRKKITTCENSESCSVLAATEAYPESSHNYANNSDITYGFSYEGAKKLTVVFSAATEVENRCDYIYIYGADGTELGKYTGKELAGKTIETEGGSFSVRLTSDGSVSKYGFAIDSITAETEGCGYYEETEAPVELPELKFNTAALVLESSLKVNFNVKKENIEGYYTDLYAVFELNGKKTIVEDFTDNGTSYVFGFANIAANNMNDTFTATLCGRGIDGKDYAGTPIEYSVAQYCYSQLGKSTLDSISRTMYVDLLNYGAESQKFTNYKTNNLANAKLTAEQASWGTSTNPELTNITDAKYAVVGNPYVTMKAVALELESTITVRIRFIAESTEGLTARIQGEYRTWEIPSGEFEETSNGYYLYFRELNATQMREPIYVTFYKDGQEVSNTLKYSIESFAKAKEKDERHQNLVISMMKYGDSAYRFANR